MKNFLQNLLIGFALALCVLVAFQWHREAKLRQQLQTLTDDIQKQREAVLALDGAVKRGEAEILRLDGLKNQLNDVVKTNKAEITKLKADLQKNDAEFDRMTKQIDVYKTALETANESIKKQNESITTQNEEMKKLATERNEVVVKFNKMAEEYNDLVKKWNEQQEQLNKGTAPKPPKPPQSSLRFFWAWRG
jgi:chromosome segregation ATPase